MMSALMMIALLLPSYDDVRQQEQTCGQETKATMSLELGGEDGAVLKLSGLEHPQHLKRWLTQEEPYTSPLTFTLYQQLVGAPVTTPQEGQRPKNSALRPVVASAVIAGAVALMLELSLGSSCEAPEPQAQALAPIAPPEDVEPVERCLICAVDPSWFDAQDPVTTNPWQQRMAQQELYYNQAQAAQAGAGFGPQGTGVIGADQASRHVVRSRAGAGTSLDRASAPSPSVRPVQGPARNSTWRAR